MNVNFTDDLVNEPDETYFLTLTKVSPFITLISPKGNFVKIDDDGNLCNCQPGKVLSYGWGHETKFSPPLHFVVEPSS